MSATYLDEIMAFHRRRAAGDDRDWQSRDPGRPGPSLRAAIDDHRAGGLAVIAEIKRRSPSKGWLAPDLDAVALARAYAAGGATAISVLTDEPHFGGSLADLRAVRDAVELPVLRKDFTVAPNDVVDAAQAGASAVLLIVDALSPTELADLMGVCATVGIDALVEVHDAAGAVAAARAGATIVGVNQRDLRTFEVDRDRAVAVLDSIAPGVLTVAESGIGGPEEAAALAAAGFDAILVGESFVRAADPAAAVSAFTGAPIGARP